MIARSIDTKSVVPILGVTVMLLLAGCAGLGGDASAPDPEEGGFDTSGGVDADPTPAPTESSDQEIEPTLGAFPGGTSERGIDTPVAVIAQHLGVLSDSSYTVVRSEAHTAADYVYSVESTLAVQGETRRLRLDYEGQSQDVYRADNASPSYIRWESTNGGRYLRDEGDVLFPGESAFFVQSVLEAATFEFVEGRTDDGREVFVFAITEFDETSDLRDATPLEDVHDLNGTVAVRSDGVIVDLDIELVGNDFDGRETTLEIGESVSAIGTTTVTEPTWLAEAQDRAVVMVAELDPGREFIAITMERGDSLPPGSTGYLYVGDIALETPIEAGLTPGESFYLYESTAGELTIAMTPPTGSNVGAPVPDGLQEVSVAIYHPDHGTVFASTLTVGDANDES